MAKKQAESMKPSGIFGEVIRQAVPKPPKGVIYGSPGIGKTTFGGSAEGAIILDCENGAGNLPYARTPYLETWEEINAWLDAIETQEHEYTVVTIDSIDWLLRRIEEHVSGSKDKMEATLNRSNGGYGNGKQVLKNYIYQALIPRFDRIINDRRIAVILLAHARRTEITDIDGITIEKSCPDLPDEYISIITEWADFVCAAKISAEGKRYLQTEETTSHVAKNRYGMPPQVALDWTAFVAAITKIYSEER